MIYRGTDAHDNAIIVVYLLYSRNRKIVLRILGHHLFVRAVRFLCIIYNDNNDCATREKLSVPLCVYSQLKFFCSNIKANYKMKLVCILTARIA